MIEQQPAPPALLVVLGASGAGKTTLVSQLAGLALPGIGCYHFDTIGVPSAEEIAPRFSTGQGWQAWALDQWVARLARNEDRLAVAVLDAQVTPSAARDAFERHAIALGRIVLVDCCRDDRHARLRGPRAQPELANSEMDNWAAFLRGQADALGLPIIDTTGASAEAGLTALLDHVAGLLTAASGGDAPSLRAG